MTPRSAIALASCTLLFPIGINPTHASDWPNWRGLDGLGVSTETNLPRTWSETENVAWKTALPGKGASSPVVVDHRIYLTTQLDSTALHILCLDAKSGKQVWNREVAKGDGPSHDLHNMATPSVVVDEGKVWAYFGTGDVVCLDLDGDVQWRRNLQADYGKYAIQWGVGTSPVKVDDRIVIAVMHQGDSYVVGLDAATGETKWKVDREYGADDESRDSYSTPLICRMETATQLVMAGENHLDAYDAATGERLWSQGGLEVDTPYGRTIAGPTFAHGKVILPLSGFQNKGRMIAFDLPQGKGGKPSIAWEVKRYSPDCPSPVVYRDLVFYVRDDGIASCVDLQTGKPYWQERVFSANCKVSPVAADGHIYFFNGQGDCAVVTATKEFKVVATNKLDGETVSSPAISGGRLFARIGEFLYCIR